MKQINTLLVLSLTASTALAQPTLTEGNNGGVPGETHLLSNFTWDGTAPSEGADQTWDYSDLSAETTALMVFYDPSEGPDSESFPGSTVVQSQDEMTYLYQGVSSEGILLNGFYASDITIYYSDPEQTMVYPFTYGDSYSDDFYSTFESGTTWNRGGTATVSASGYGTLKLPEATLEDVLLVKLEEDYGDTAFGEEVYHYYTTIYQFFRLGVSHPVLSFTSITIVGFPPSYTASFNGDASLFLEEEAFDFSIYPNPAQEVVYLQNNTDLNIESVMVYSSTGSSVYQSKNAKAPIDILNWESGIYFVELTTSTGKTIEKFVKS